jgi:outer membrane protein insertion porin family
LLWGDAALRSCLAARKHLCLRILAWALLVYLVGIGSAAARPVPPQDAQGTPNPFYVERIDFEGNRRIRSETLRARIFTRDGDPYKAESLERDFRALWNTGYFEDIRLEVQDSPDHPNGKIIVFYLSERPIIRRIEYKGLKTVTESDVLDAFKDAKVGLSVEAQFDPTKIKKAQVVIQELLAAHGHQFATVKPTYEKIAATNAVKLVFVVDEGPKVKIGKIIIQGNHAFSTDKIIRAMKRSRPYGIPLYFKFIPVLSKTYDKDKLDEDLEVGIRNLYQDNGYFKVVVKDPIVQTVEINRRGLPGPIPVVGREHGKATNITIGIEEGDKYRMGKLVVRSSDPDKGLTIKRAFLESIFPLHKGDVFSVGKVRTAVENYTKFYGQYGFINFTAIPETDVNDATKTIDLTFDFDEGKQFSVRRIEFSGNTTTRDKVIRRELLLNEGDLYNNRLWEISLLRLNQLNYFDVIKPENAEVKQNVKNSTVDITLKVKEKGKQSISLTGGVSGISGSFLGLTYQTNNFLGLGETLTFTAQFGTIQRNFVFGFTEPYFLDRPIQTGFTISSSRYNFDQSRETSLLLGEKVELSPDIAQNYNQNSAGITVFASYPIKKFSFTRLGLTYGFTDTSIQSFSTASTVLFDALQFQQLAGPSALSGIHSSRISPSLSYNTVDNPQNPSHGKSFFVQGSFEGGPLGGNVKAVSTTVSSTYFRPNYHRRNVIALRVLGAFTSGYGGLEVPPYDRFYLGGEDTLRGFDVRTVSPVVFIPVLSTSTTFTYFDPRVLSSQGTPVQVSTPAIPALSYQIAFPGGDTEALGNFEYRIPIVGSHVGLSFFTDAGVSGALLQSQLALSAPGLQQIQQYGFALPNSNGHLPVVGDTNFKLRASSGIEIVANLPIVNAPIRLYWAYNWEREELSITAPEAQFDQSLLDNLRASLPPGVYNAQILPQILATERNTQLTEFYDPVKVLRLTISRTF